MKTKNFYILILSLFALIFAGCGNDDEIESGSIFVNDPEPDPNAYNYDFDRWLDKVYLNVYNVDFQYKFLDVSANMDYNLVPAKFEKSQEMAILLKHLWFDAYEELMGKSFLQNYSPRVVSLIGSEAINEIGNNTEATTEGGVKIGLYAINKLDPADVESLNERYFKIMHREFMVILTQKKTIPKTFREGTAGRYDPQNWYNRTTAEAATLGCVSTYGLREVNLDFVDIIAHYIAKDDAWWDYILDMAKKENVTGSSGNLIEDGIEGDVVILAKLELCKSWLKEAWNIDLEELRNIVQRRQKDIDYILAPENRPW